MGCVERQEQAGADEDGAEGDEQWYPPLGVDLEVLVGPSAPADAGDDVCDRQAAAEGAGEQAPADPVEGVGGVPADDEQDADDQVGRCQDLSRGGRSAARQVRLRWAAAVRWWRSCRYLLEVGAEEMGLGRGEEARGQEDDRDDGEGRVQSGGRIPVFDSAMSAESEDRGRCDGSAYVLDQERQVGDVQGLVDR